MAGVCENFQLFTKYPTLVPDIYKIRICRRITYLLIKLGNSARLFPTLDAKNSACIFVQDCTITCKSDCCIGF